MVMYSTNESDEESASIAKVWAALQRVPTAYEVAALSEKASDERLDPLVGEALYDLAGELPYFREIGMAFLNQVRPGTVLAEYQRRFESEDSLQRPPETDDVLEGTTAADQCRDLVQRLTAYDEATARSHDGISRSFHKTSRLSGVEILAEEFSGGSPEKPAPSGQPRNERPNKERHRTLPGRRGEPVSHPPTARITRGGPAY